MNMIWNNMHNINLKPNPMEMVEKTEYLSIESQNRFKYQFDDKSHPSDLHIRFGAVSNRTDDKTIIHTNTGSSSHLKTVYQNVKSIELVNVTIPKIMNYDTPSFLMSNTDIYVVSLRDFYNACDSNNELIDNSFGILRPIDRKMIQPIYKEIEKDIEKYNQGYIDLIPLNAVV